MLFRSKFTTTAIQYGKCKRLKMTGWTYPHEESLEHLIIQKKLYPITVLPSVLLRDLPSLGRSNLMLVRDIASFTPEFLAKKIDIKKSHAEQIVSEALVCLAEKT